MLQEEGMRYRNSRKTLMKLKGGNSAQLICLLHGPGGSGKSTVINLVRAYAKEYCHLIGHPFTIRTLVITAMSGVAATLIHGETTHSAVGLNRPNLSQKFKDAWKDTRLFICDECSFGSDKDFTKMEVNLTACSGRTFDYLSLIHI